MKTTKEALIEIRKMANTLNAQDPGPAWQIMLDLLDDLDELEKKCSWQAEMLERVHTDLLRGNGDTEDQWLADLERGPKE